MQKLLALSLLFVSSVDSKLSNQLTAKTLTQTKTSRDYTNNPFTTSLADCQEFAALFDNTCDTTTAPDTLDDVSSKARFCTNIGGCDDALECSEPYLTLITKGR